MRIAFLGDFAVFANGVITGNWKKAFSDVEKVLREYDLVVANLEEPLTEIKSTLVCKGIHIKANKEVIEILKYLHIRVVCLANNHICDYGKKGMQDTIDYLDEAGIEYYGINGKNLDYYLGKEKITFHGFCCYSTNGAMYIEISKKKGVNALTKKAVQKALNDDIYKKSFSILSFHWGDEYSHLPNKTQIELCRELSDKYNFIIQGHHTHVMQGVEKIKNSLIAYSQGNFYFEDIQSEVNSKLQVRQSAITREGFILGVEILNTEITDWRIIGIRREEERISIINNFDKIKTISEKINDYKNAEYEKEAKSMIISQKKSNRGNHDFKWFMSKLNYYSIGAELKSHLYKKKYDRAYK